MRNLYRSLRPQVKYSKGYMSLGLINLEQPASNQLVYRCFAYCTQCTIFVLYHQIGAMSLVRQPVGSTSFNPKTYWSDGPLVQRHFGPGNQIL